MSGSRVKSLVSRKELVEYYSNQADDESRMYADLRRGHQQMRRLELIREMALRLPLGDERIADLGCGDGFAAETVLADVPYACYLGVDLSAHKLRRVAKRLPRARVVVGDVENVPLSSRSVGLALCLETLEHLPDPLEALREIARILRPDGAALISVPVDSSAQKWALAAASALRRHRGGKRGFREHLQVFTMHGIRRLLAQCRLRVTVARCCSFGFPFSDLVVPRVPYTLWSRWDRLASNIPLGAFGLPVKPNFTLGREYAVLLVRPN